MITCECIPTCGKQFLRKEGIGRFGKWFCSDECLDRDEDV